MFRAVADIKTADQLHLPAPLVGGRHHTVVVPASANLCICTKTLADRARKLSIPVPGLSHKGVAMPETRRKLHREFREGALRIVRATGNPSPSWLGILGSTTAR
jgi:hypothetical protein